MGVLILGNSFAAYADALTDAQTADAARWCALARATPFATEEACGEPAGDGGAFRNAFNSLSLHTFAPPRLPPPADAAWAAPFADRPPEESLPCALHAHILGADDQDAHAAVT